MTEFEPYPCNLVAGGIVVLVLVAIGVTMFAYLIWKS